MVKWMRAFFQYLDRFYVEMHSCTKLSDQGYKIFKEVVFQPLCDNTTQAIVAEIKKQRDGDEMIDLQLLQGSVAIYLNLSTGKLAQDGFLPSKNLDKAILEHTQQFYEAKSKEIMDSTNLIDYLKVADRYCKEEQTRIEKLLTWDIGIEVLKVFRSEMLVKPQAVLLSKEKGFKEFMNQK